METVEVVQNFGDSTTAAEILDMSVEIAVEAIGIAVAADTADTAVIADTGFEEVMRQLYSYLTGLGTDCEAQRSVE